MSNKKDVRYLLIDEFWPEDYEDSDLYAKADEILWENQKLKGDRSYQKSIRDEGNKKNEEGKIKFLSVLLYLFDLDEKSALYVIKETNSKYKTKEEVKKALNNRIFDKEVERVQAEGKEQIKKEITFESMCIPIEKYFKITLDRDITVVKYWAWVEELKRAIA
jgi:hypothetical protein